MNQNIIIDILIISVLTNVGVIIFYEFFRRKRIGKAQEERIVQMIENLTKQILGKRDSIYE